MFDLPPTALDGPVLETYIGREKRIYSNFKCFKTFPCTVER